MKKWLTCASAALLLLNVPAVAHAVTVQIHNELSACTAIHTEASSIEGNGVQVRTVFQLRNSLADCGCRSALANYTSVTYINGAPQLLQHGLLGLKKSGEKTLVLASEATLIANNKIQLRFNCAPAL